MPVQSVPSQYIEHRNASPAGVYTIMVLCYANMLNYMDRFGLLAVLPDMRAHFGVSENMMVLLPTIFAFCYMLCGLLFGYLGDRRPRYVLLLVAVSIWWLAASLATFCTCSYWMFFVCRLGVAAGEAGFTAVAPSVLADTVGATRRTVALAFFFAAIPVGSASGYVINAYMAQFSGDWWWGMRLTALLGMISVLGLFLIDDPERGEREAAMLGMRQKTERPALWDDFIFLLTNITYMLTTLALTTISYVLSVLAWWLPHYIYLGQQIIEGKSSTDTEMDVSISLALIFIVSGIGAAVLATLISSYVRKHVPNIDTVLCSFFSLTATVLLAATVLMSNESMFITYFLILFSLMALNTNWTLTGDVLLYVAVHTNRCIATALQMLVVHGLGGVIGPYIVGMTFEHCKTDCGITHDNSEFHALRLALLSTFLASAFAAAFYLVASYFLEDDRDEAVKFLLAT